MRRLLLLAVVALVIPLAPPASSQGRDWTFLVYMAADNDLEPDGIADFLEMSSVGSTSEVAVVVQFDRVPGYSNAYGDWNTTKRFYVTPGMLPTAAAQIADIGEQNMADPTTLFEFVDWGMTQYPARHYFLVLWDHGLGWQGVVTDESSGGDLLNATELRTAIGQVVTAQGGRRLDLLGNDACRMSMEIMYELSDLVDYFVGSEKDEPLDGWPYDALLSAVVADPTMTPSEVAAKLVDVYVESYEGTSPYSVALSAVNALALRSVVPSLDAFLGELEVEHPYFAADLIAARAATEHYEQNGLDYDLFHFVENVLVRVPSRRIWRAGLDVLGAIQAAVVYERHWDNPSPVNGVHAVNAHGLSLFFPASFVSPEYDLLLLSRDSMWNEFLTWYGVGPRPQVAANANGTTRDSDGDGLLDELVLEYTPAINGTMFVDVYLDGLYGFSREYRVTANRSDEVRYRIGLGGYLEVSFYLVNGTGALVNLTLVEGLVIEERIVFRGRVFGDSGLPIEGASVALVHAASGARLSVTTDANGYAITAVYPTWFEQGDGLALEATSADRQVRVEFNVTLTFERTVVRDIHLDTAGMGAWLAAFGGLAVATALASVVAFYYWRRFRNFKRIP